jgi:hypothetical protein
VEKKSNLLHSNQEKFLDDSNQKTKENKISPLITLEIHQNTKYPEKNSPKFNTRKMAKIQNINIWNHESYQKIKIGILFIYKFRKL